MLNKKSIGAAFTAAIMVMSVFSAQQAFALNGGTLFSVKPLSTTTEKVHSSKVRVNDCDEIDGGINITRGNKNYDLMDGTKDTGHGLKQYEFECLSSNIYKVSWAFASSKPLSSPISKPLSSPISKPLSSPISKPLSSPISKPLSSTGGEATEQSVESGASKVNVADCREVRDGISIRRNGSRYYTVLKNGIKNAGNGERDYTFSCVSDTQYQVKWTTV